MRERAQIVILGAGVIGSAVAKHLVQFKSGKAKPEVRILDLDLEGSFSSSELNAGGVRATWNHPLNVELARDSIQYFEKVAAEVGLRQRGYFWLYGKEQWSAASERLQRNAAAYGLNLELLSPSEITQRHPFIDKTTDLGGATFSPKDGLINPNLVKNHFRNEAQAGGAQFVDRCYITSIEAKNSGARISGVRFLEALSDEQREQLLTQHKISDDVRQEKFEIEADVLVLCPGPWAERFQRMLKVPVHSRAVRRQVSLFECKQVDLTANGMFVDSSGVYFHAEAQYILSGFAVESEPPGYNFHYDGNSFFEEHIWSALHERATGFEQLKHVTGWAGLYEVSPDRAGIVGKVSGTSGIYEAHSFSGRGLMQSWAVGRGLAELILSDRFETIDLAPLNSERFAQNRLVKEDLLI